MSMQPLTIGVTTFNRRPVLEVVARSLAQVEGLERARVWVMDDCSSEFDADYLRRLFPRAEVFRSDENSGGADQAMVRLFKRFEADGSGHLLNLDADLLASRGLVDKCLEIIDTAAGVRQPCLFSVFNTASHPVIGTDGEFVLKRTVGAAGTLWEHGLLADVLRNVAVSRKFDWDWSAYLTGRGVPIRVTRRSYVQHIGRVGQHSRSFAGMDHGVGFEDYEGQNLSAFLDHINDGLAQMLSEQNSRHRKLTEAIVQLTEVAQGQAALINQLIGELVALGKR
jgi:glycosyl transferase family 2